MRKTGLRAAATVASSGYIFGYIFGYRFRVYPEDAGRALIGRRHSVHVPGGEEDAMNVPLKVVMDACESMQHAVAVKVSSVAVKVSLVATQ